MLTVLMAFYTFYSIMINDFLGVAPSFWTGRGIDLHYSRAERQLMIINFNVLSVSCIKERKKNSGA